MSPAFTVIVTRLTAARKVEEIPFTVKDSRSKLEAILRPRVIRLEALDGRR